MNILKRKVTSHDLEKSQLIKELIGLSKIFSQNIFMSTSFGIQSAVMLHIITQKNTSYR